MDNKSFRNLTEAAKNVIAGKKKIKVDHTTTDPSGNQTQTAIDISPEEVAKLGVLSPIGQLTKIIKDKINRKKSPEQPQSPTQTEAVKEAPKIKLPRQLKDPKSEMMVTSPKGKTFVIYKSEWPEHEKSGHTVAESVSLGESADSTELHLFTVNHPGIHASRMTSIHKNLRNKMAKGTYDSDKAHKAFMYAAKDGADAYHHEHGHKFHKSVRHDVATTMRNEFESEAKDGQHDHHLHKKYRKENLKDHVELSELSRKKLIDIINTTGAELAGDLHTDKGKVTPRTNKLARVKAKAKKKLDRLRIDPEKFGTGHVYKPDKIQGKWVDTQEEISPNSRKVLEIMAKKKKDYPKQSERAGKMLQRIDGESNPTKVNDMMARVQKRKAERKAKYDAMTPEEQKADDRMWAEVDADKIKHNWRESVEQNESLGGPGGPSREMSPNDMYSSGLRTNEILKKLEKLKKANKKKKTKSLQNKK